MMSFLSLLWERATATPASKAARCAYLDFKYTGGNPKFINGEHNPNYNPKKELNHDTHSHLDRPLRRGSLLFSERSRS